MFINAHSIFQAESTRKKQIQKLLSILPRRGPRAFDKFVRAIQDSYDWLAKPLRDTLHELNLKNGRFVTFLSYHGRIVYDIKVVIFKISDLIKHIVKFSHSKP